MFALLFAVLLATRPFTPEELLATRRVDDVQVSPDGKWASLTVRQKNLETNKDDKDIWLLSLPAGQPRQLTRNAQSEHARWSPDGKQLVVVRDGQLWLYDLNGGDARPITALSGGADAAVFSPDGRWIAFSSEVYPQCGGNDACNKERKEQREKSGVQARIVDHLFARHWTEWKDGKRTHVFVMPAGSGPARDVTPLDSDWPSVRIGGGDDFRFTPDGERSVRLGAPTGTSGSSTATGARRVTSLLTTTATTRSRGPRPTAATSPGPRSRETGTSPISGS